MRASLRVSLAQLRSAGATLVLLAVIIGLTAGIAVAAPRGVTHATSQELRTAISELSEERRNPSGQIRDLFVLSIPLFTSETLSEDAIYGGLFGTLEEIRQEQPEPLRSALSEAEVVVIGESVQVAAAVPEAADPLFLVRSIVDPLLEDRVRVVDGRLPEAWVPLGGPPLGPGSLAEPEEFVPPNPIELVLTTDGADAMRWSIGELRVDPASNIELELVGIVEPVDPEAAYWRGIPGAPEAERFDDGNQQPRETAAAFVSPQSVGAPTAFGPISVWYPLDVSQLDASTIEEFLPQLRSFLSTGLTIPSSFDEGPPVTTPLTSDIPAASDRVLDRASVTTAVLALMVAGPLGTLAVVLLLASRSTIDRRRSVLALQLARGASRTRLRVSVVLDSLLVTVPATLVGSVVGVLFAGALTDQTPALALAGLVSAPVLLLLALIALIPAALLAALLPRAADLRERRADLTGPGRARALVDLVIVTLAALSVWLVLQRGVVTSAVEVGIDPLLVAMPLLVALAASVLTMRVYPALVSAAQGVVGRAGSAISVIGARRASRERAVGPPVVVATVIAASVAVSSLSLLAVLDAGLEGAARDRLGAEVRVTGPGVSADLVTAASDLPEAAAVGGIDVVGPAVMSVEGVRENATVITVDEVTARLRDDAPADWPRATATTEGDRVPVILSEDLLPRVDGLPAPDAAITVDGVPVTVVATGRTSTGYGSSGSWVLVGEADAELFTSRPAVDTLLAEPAPGVTPSELGDALTALAAEVATGDARVAIAAEAAADERAIPLTAALRLTLLAGAALAVALAIATLAVASVVGRPRRQRVQALAHVLGVRRSSSLVAWELAPPALLGTLVGGLVGVGLVLLATAAVDLRFVTGAADAVGASFDAVLIGATVAAVLVGVTVVVAIATALDRRPPLLTTLRTESS